jgi:hypothetical protein
MMPRARLDRSAAPVFLYLTGGRPILASSCWKPLPSTCLADAETVNDRLEAWIGADRVIFRIDVDE